MACLPQAIGGNHRYHKALQQRRKSPKPRAPASGRLAQRVSKINSVSIPAHCDNGQQASPCDTKAFLSGPLPRKDLNSIHAYLTIMPLSHSVLELTAWLRLSLEPGVGPATAYTLLNTAGLPEHIYDMGAAALMRCVA